MNLDLNEVSTLFILLDFKFDIIVSNPPYIRSDEIKTLQSEVLEEPIMALDGGADGLVFYRTLVNDWSAKLKENGFMAF